MSVTEIYNYISQMSQGPLFIWLVLYLFLIISLSLFDAKVLVLVCFFLSNISDALAFQKSLLTCAIKSRLHNLEC